MARDPEVKQLQSNIDSVLAYKKDELIVRQKWGEITFEEAERDFDRIFDLLNHLKILPLEFLTDQAVSGIVNEITPVKQVFDKVDKFALSTPNPVEAKNQLVTQIHSRADSLYTVTSQWIPFLAYQKGDVAENIDRLTKAVTDANTIIDDAKISIISKGKEIDDLIVKAREASVKAGVGVFTEDFQRESEKIALRAKAWLRSTYLIAGLTLLVAIFMWYFTEAGLDQNQMWQKMTTKLAILVLLLTGTGWCAKIYKALLHQATVNRHRALSLQTFQAFSSAASDAATKDAVLFQTTKSIFSDSGTGFVEGSHSSPDSDFKILEVVKSILPKT